MSDYIPPVPSLLASASPATRGTARRMTIYFQPSPNPNDPNIVGANENDPPVAPAIDSDIDIAISNKKRYIQYAVDRSTNATANNPTPLSPEVGTTAQRTYINQDPELNYSGIPNAFNVFNDSPTMFDNQTLTRDAGVAQVDIINTEVGRIKGHYAGNVGRPFAIRKYVGQLNALETSDPDSDAQKNAHHNRLVDAQLLSFRGANSQNKHVPPAGEDPETRDNSIPLGNMFYQGGLGKFAVGTYVRQDTSKATELTVEQLKQVGLNIVFNAVGGNDIDANIKTPGDAALAELALAAPIGPRIGQKVKLSRFSAAREAQKLFGATKSSSTTFIDTDDDIDSYGSFNNPFSQFDALVSVGQIAVTVTMILAFSVVLNGLLLFISLNADDPGVRRNILNRVKGSSTLIREPNMQEPKVYPTETTENLGDFFSNMLGLNNIFRKPNHAFDDCLSEGLKEFFGFSVRGGSASDTSMKIMTESGRLNVILREMIRNGVDLGESAAAAFSGAGASSPIAGVTGFFKSLTELKIINFINVLVNIGDKVLEKDDPSNAEQVDVDQLNDNYLIGKSRLSSNGSLAWSTTTAPYYSLTLATLASPLLSRLESDLNLTPQSPPNSTNQYGSALDGRISAREVKIIEDSLESDYMPFYFHDLRTNEIMSFHAFLENASEDFSVEYTSQEGYGRMDKVQIYKGTTRNITVDFKMIATNADSHDDMWYKINRLAMMIYPQWTQGRKLDVGNLKFIQPFSQIPGATPVIRLRLGDLYKSNYSKMAVARLFGATTRPDYSVSGSIAAQTTNAVSPQPPADAAAPPAPVPAPPAPAPRTGARRPAPGAATAGVGGSGPLDDALLADYDVGSSNGTVAGPSNLLPQVLKLLEGSYAAGGEYTGGPTADTPAAPARRGRHRAIRTQRNLNNIFVPNDKLIFNGSNHAVQNLLRNKYIKNGSSGNNPGISPFNQNDRLVNFFGGSLINAKYVSCDRNKVIVEIESIQYMGILYGLARSDRTRSGRLQAPASPSRLEIRFDKFNTAGFLNIKYIAMALQQRLESAATPPAAAASTASTGVDPNSMNPSIFYDDTKNPILKAFNSTAGKGLAGVITSFKVDYKESDKRWGIDAENKLRAPMYVTISVTMAVIHDIPLGLDANGIMNAPIWPVGNSSNYFMRNSNPGLTADDEM